MWTTNPETLPRVIIIVTVIIIIIIIMADNSYIAFTMPLALLFKEQCRLFILTYKVKFTPSKSIVW